MLKNGLYKYFLQRIKVFPTGEDLDGATQFKTPHSIVILARHLSKNHENITQVRV